MLSIDDPKAFSILTQTEGRLWASGQPARKNQPNSWNKLQEVWRNFKSLKLETGIKGDDEELEYSASMVDGSIFLFGAGTNRFKLLSTGEIVFISAKASAAKIKQIKTLGINTI